MAANELVPKCPNRAEVFTRAAEARPLEPVALLADLQALARPASRRDIGEHSAIIIGCYPNAKTEDAEIYGRAFAEYIAEANPALSDLEAARHRIIKTFVFRPSIAEVLMVLEAEKQLRLQRTDRIEYLVKHPKPDTAAISRFRQQPKHMQQPKSEIAHAKSRDDDEEINY